MEIPKMGIVKIFLKHDDRTSFEFDENQHGDGERYQFEMNSDYLPYVGVFGGDDTQLIIDNETGKIIGWKPLVKEDFEEYESKNKAAR
jgi:hypothetical protein